GISSRRIASICHCGDPYHTESVPQSTWSTPIPLIKVVPTANPKPLTATANRLILAADERSLQVDLVRLDRTVQVAGCVGSRDPGPSTPTQRAAAQIPEAIGVRQY